MFLMMMKSMSMMILQDGEEVKVEPNIMTYTSVLNAWSRSNDPIQCDRIYEEMISPGSNIIPDRRVYALMVSAWGRHKPPSETKTTKTPPQ